MFNYWFTNMQISEIMEVFFDFLTVYFKNLKHDEKWLKQYNKLLHDKYLVWITGIGFPAQILQEVQQEIQPQRPPEQIKKLSYTDFSSQTKQIFAAWQIVKWKTFILVIKKMIVLHIISKLFWTLEKDVLVSYFFILWIKRIKEKKSQIFHCFWNGSWL